MLESVPGAATPTVRNSVLYDIPSSVIVLLHLDQNLVDNTVVYCVQYAVYHRRTGWERAQLLRGLVSTRLRDAQATTWLLHEINH